MANDDRPDDRDPTTDSGDVADSDPSDDAPTSERVDAEEPSDADAEPGQMGSPYGGRAPDTDPAADRRARAGTDQRRDRVARPQDRGRSGFQDAVSGPVGEPEPAPDAQPDPGENVVEGPPPADQTEPEPDTEGPPGQQPTTAYPRTGEQGAADDAEREREGGARPTRATGAEVPGRLPNDADYTAGTVVNSPVHQSRSEVPPETPVETRTHEIEYNQQAGYLGAKDEPGGRARTLATNTTTIEVEADNRARMRVDRHETIITAQRGAGVELSVRVTERYADRPTVHGGTKAIIEVVEIEGRAE